MLIPESSKRDHLFGGHSDLLSEPHKLFHGVLQEEGVFFVPILGLGTVCEQLLRSSHVAVPPLLGWEHSLGRLARAAVTGITPTSVCRVVLDCDLPPF